MGADSIAPRKRAQVTSKGTERVAVRDALCVCSRGREAAENRGRMTTITQMNQRAQMQQPTAGAVSILCAT